MSTGMTFSRAESSTSIDGDFFSVAITTPFVAMDGEMSKMRPTWRRVSLARLEPVPSPT